MAPSNRMARVLEFLQIKIADARDSQPGGETCPGGCQLLIERSFAQFLTARLQVPVWSPRWKPNIVRRSTPSATALK